MFRSSNKTEIQFHNMYIINAEQAKVGTLNFHWCKIVKLQKEIQRWDDDIETVAIHQLAKRWLNGSCTLDIINDK